MKSKTKRHDPPLIDGFEEKELATGNGEGVLRHVKADAVPVLARPGMTCFLCDCKSQYGVVRACLPDYAIVQGSQGEWHVVFYGELDLCGAAPDPAHVLRPPTGEPED